MVEATNSEIQSESDLPMLMCYYDDKIIIIILFIVNQTHRNK